MHHTLTPAAQGLDDLATDNTINDGTVIMFKELLIKFPDLVIYRPDPLKPDCWPCSKTVSRIVDEVQFYDYKDPEQEHIDVYAWPSTAIGSFRVFSDPPSYIIGKVNAAGFGVIPTEQLEESMEENEINLKVIRKVRMYLKGRPAIFYM